MPVSNSSGGSNPALDAYLADLRARLASLSQAAPAERHAFRQLLLDKIHSPSVPMRALAAEGLGRVGDERAVRPLIAALHDPAPLVQWRAAYALRALHVQALVPDDRLVFQEGRHFEQWKAGVLQRLVGMLYDPGHSIRREAATSLAEIGVPDVLPDLVAVAFDDEIAVREAAATAILTLAGAHPTWCEPARQGLLPALRAGDPLVRRTAADLLTRLDPRAAIPDLLGLLHDPDATVRALACTILGGLRDPATAGELIGRLADDHPEVRCSSAGALGHLGDPYAVPALVQLGNDEYPAVRQAVLEALGRIGGPAVAPVLLGGLRDPDPGVRLAAIGALERLGDEAALKPLAALARDRAPAGGTVVGEAATAAGKAIRARLRGNRRSA